MSDPRDGHGKFLLNPFNVLNQVFVERVPAVLKEWSDINAESFDEKILIP